MFEQRQMCPIRRWKLSNFKSVEDADVELAPLTVLVGANSSGKSSLLQSILMIAQAAQEGPSAWLPLNGPFVELGDIQDVVFAGVSEESDQIRRRKKKQFRVGATFDIGSDIPSIRHRPDQSARTEATRNSQLEWDAAFASVPGGKGIGVAQLTYSRLVFEAGGDGETWWFETTGTRRKELEVVAGNRLLNVEREVVPLRGRLNQKFRSRRESSISNGGRSKDRHTAGLVQTAGIPLQFFLEIDRTQYEAEEILERLERRYFRDRFEDSDSLSPRELQSAISQITRLIVDRLEEPPDRRDQSRLKMSRELRHLLSGLTLPQKERIISSIKKLVSKGEKVLGPLERRPGIPIGLERLGFWISSFMARNIRYLGPLREDPRVVYLPTPGERAGKVGKKGEKAVALLHAHRNDKIVCFFHDGSPSEERTLAEGIQYWLHYFGIAEAIETELRPRLGLEPHLDLPDVDRTLDMTAVGVGVSQIFPVLVMGLHSPPGSVLLMEQPELHLHPALQQRLGDFLLACARSGRQLIVETHSDHLISRLRRRIAEDEKNELYKQLAIVFAERNEGRTSYRRVEVNQYGGIEEWPKGFFDQAARESQLILRAGLAKKKQDSEKP